MVSVGQAECDRLRLTGATDPLTVFWDRSRSSALSAEIVHYYRFRWWRLPPTGACYRCGNIGRVNEVSNFPQRLTALLAERKMTQLELAARIGVTRAAMSRYVSGEREPRLVTLVRIAEELDVNVDDLVAAESHSVETALRIVARSTFTEEEKSRLREALESGGRP